MGCKKKQIPSRRKGHWFPFMQAFLSTGGRSLAPARRFVSRAEQQGHFGASGSVPHLESSTAKRPLSNFAGNSRQLFLTFDFIDLTAAIKLRSAEHLSTRIPQFWPRSTPNYPRLLSKPALYSTPCEAQKPPGIPGMPITISLKLIIMQTLRCDADREDMQSRVRDQSRFAEAPEKPPRCGKRKALHVHQIALLE